MKVETAVLKLTGNALFGAGFEIPSNIDWEAVYEECKKQTVTILGFYGADQVVGVDPEVKKTLGERCCCRCFSKLYCHFFPSKLTSDDG